MPVVVSVPHSGTKSLLAYLRTTCSQKEREEGPMHIFHFGVHDDLIAQCEFQLHIPLRDPTEIMKSWINRSKDLADLYKAMESMLNYSGSNTTVYKIEDVPIILGSEAVVITPPNKATLIKMLSDNVSTKVLDYYKLRYSI